MYHWLCMSSFLGLSIFPEENHASSCWSLTRQSVSWAKGNRVKVDDSLLSVLYFFFFLIHPFVFNLAPCFPSLPQLCLRFLSREFLCFSVSRKYISSSVREEGAIPSPWWLCKGSRALTSPWPILQPSLYWSSQVLVPPVPKHFQVLHIHLTLSMASLPPKQQGSSPFFSTK